MKQVPLFPEYVFDEVAAENVIGSRATLEDIERGLSSDKEVTRNRWDTIDRMRKERGDDRV